MVSCLRWPTLLDHGSTAGRGCPWCRRPSPGLAANGLDLVQHGLHPLLPGVSVWITPVMGVFYLVWFPMLAWDLTRLARSGVVTEHLARADA